MSLMPKLLEINDELVRVREERDRLREERDEAVEHAARLHAELDATRKQLQDVCSAKPAGQSDLVRDVSHYTEAAEVDRSTEPQPEPVQVSEGRWRTRSGKVRYVTAMPTDHEDFAVSYPWWDGDVMTWANNGLFFNGQTAGEDLVEYLGPLKQEPQPEPQFKPYTFAAYIVGDKSQPDALRIVWATEEWIQHSQFGIVHRMRDMQFFGNDGGCNITEYHETLTLSLEVQ